MEEGGLVQRVQGEGAFGSEKDTWIRSRGRGVSTCSWDTEGGWEGGGRRERGKGKGGEKWTTL